MPSNGRRLIVANDLRDKSESGLRLASKVEDCAESLAELLDLPMTYVYVTEDMGANLDLQHAVNSRSRREVNARTRRLRRQPEVLLKTGTPAREIADETNVRPRTEIVVMGTKGLGGFEHFWKGSVAEDVISQSSRPVVVVGPKVRTGHVPTSNLSILVATDLTASSKAAEKYALQLAKKFSSKLRFLFCLGDELMSVQDGVINSGYVNYDLSATISEIQAHAKVEIAQRIERMKKLGISATGEIRQGTAVNEIARSAVRGTDLILMGTRGRNHLASSFFGSTARATILSSTVPVVVVPTNTKF